MTAVPEDVLATVAGLVSLIPSRGHRVRSPFLRSLLPRPTESLEAWQRFTHQDVDSLSVSERQAESFRLRVSLAAVPAEDAPLWVLDRLARLDVA